ncbi:Histone deacetylase HDA1 [Clarias magur]|uniref:Histone deacetylase HDA1 n=1 Tax=Clarias magur TaxID=1594786 RepID=A0A8J4TZ40_CLAMG|nr:Histone deacetylase HDA1 [Clarias magur]
MTSHRSQGLCGPNPAGGSSSGECHLSHLQALHMTHLLERMRAEDVMDPKCGEAVECSTPD